MAGAPRDHFRCACASRTPTGREYLANGAQLGSLIDPSTQTIEVYRPNREPETPSSIEPSMPKPLSEASSRVCLPSGIPAPFRQSPPLQKYFHPIPSTLYKHSCLHPRTARLILVLKMSLHIHLAPALPAPHLPFPPLPRIFPLPARLFFIGGKNSPVWSNKVIGPPIKTLGAYRLVLSAFVRVYLRPKSFRAHFRRPADA
jgi:hypothetical protein